MKELGKSESAKEIAKLKKRNSSKSPVKVKVMKFEGKLEDDITSPEKRYGPPSPTRSKSPGINQKDPHQFVSPTRSKSPGINQKDPHQFASPTRSKSPGISSYLSNRLPSPSRSKSPGVNIERPNKLFSPSRSMSPGVTSSGQSSPSRSKSPLKRERKAIGSPGGDSPGGGRSKSALSNRSLQRSPDVVSLRGNTPTEASPKVGDPLELSWDLLWYANADRVDSQDASGVNQDDPGPSKEAESAMKDNQTMTAEGEQRFRNILIYDMVAWEDITFSGEPKKADDFIQRLCGQVRDHAEYMCDTSFVSYEAISYKVKIAEAGGILYYVKVNVWENHCVHLRILSHKSEFKAVPKLQAILELAEPDRGNIEFF